MDKFIDIKGISHCYNKKQMALEDITISIKKGEFVGLVGPNGAGKSTLIKIISGLIHPTKGEVLFKNNKLKVEDYAYKKSIGVVMAENIMYGNLTVSENLEFFAAMYNMKKSETKSRIEQLLAQVKLEDKRKTKVKELSTGMKQKINVIRAILHSPEILILDEPTSGLDPISGKNIRKLLTDINEQETTILMSSHNMYEVEDTCSRLLLINSSKIIFDGTAEEAISKYGGSKLVVKFSTDISVDSVQDLLKEYETKVVKGNLLYIKSISFEDALAVVGELKSKVGNIIEISMKKENLEEVFVEILDKE